MLIRSISFRIHRLHRKVYSHWLGSMFYSFNRDMVSLFLSTVSPLKLQCERKSKVNTSKIFHMYKLEQIEKLTPGPPGRGTLQMRPSQHGSALSEQLSPASPHCCLRSARETAEADTAAPRRDTTVAKMRDLVNVNCMTSVMMYEYCSHLILVDVSWLVCKAP